MARKAKDGGNGVDPRVMSNAMGALLDLAGRLDSEKGAYMRRCRSIREEMAAVYDEANAKGATKLELKALFKSKRLFTKASAVLANLEPDQRDRANMMADALGDEQFAPLFAFAKKAKAAPVAANGRAKRKRAPAPSEVAAAPA